MKFSKKVVGALSSVVYIALNVVLALSAWAAVIFIDSIFLAIILIMVSKWRVLAVKRRYWLANIESNLVDFLVGLSFVLIMSQVGVDNWLNQIILLLLYIGWLVFIKPRSGQKAVFAQSLISLIVSIASLLSISHNLNLVFVILIAFTIGYSSLKHLLQDQDKNLYDVKYLAISWGFFTAVLVWIFANWNVAYKFAFYRLNFLGDFKIAEGSIIIGALGFAIFSLLTRFVKVDNTDEQKLTKIGVIKVDKKDVLAPVVFSLLLILIFLIFFTSPNLSL